MHTHTPFVCIIISIFLCFSSLLYEVRGQIAGTATAEVHPALTTYSCTASGCTAQSQSVVIDANWRWIHDKAGYVNCFSGTWDATLCPDPATCASNCMIEGASYASTYGITTAGSALTLQFVTGTNVGSRVYLLQDDKSYQLFKLLNREFAFTVDSSQLGCGLNGAVYFVEMDQDGGTTKYPGNKAGAQYGTGYCDAQCPQDVKFINGEANTVNWNGHAGKYGACCMELDIWEANSISTAFTTHPCTISTSGQYKCSGAECANSGNRYEGICDKDGCDFNAYRMGATSFYGPNKAIDTNKPITVVTQFITTDGTDNGDLKEIRRSYVQDGKVIANPKATWPELTSHDSITDNMCDTAKTLFGDVNDHKAKGGMKTMGESLRRGVVLVLSLWADTASQMLWLDSNVPVTGSASTPGVARGSCPTTSGAYDTVVSQYASATVKYSDIKWGPIGSTTTGVSGGGSQPATTAPTTPPAAATQPPTQPPAQPTQQPPVATIQPTSPPPATQPPAAATQPPTQPSTTEKPEATEKPKATKKPTATKKPKATTKPTPVAQATTAPSSTCKAAVKGVLDGVWPNDSGLLRLLISNNGTVPLKSVTISASVPGTTSYFALDVVSDSGSQKVFSLPSWAVPIPVGGTYTSAGFVFNYGRPTVKIASATC